MKKLFLLMICAVLAISVGCAVDSWNKNPLKNLTDKQSDWFDRTSDGWNFD